MNTNDMDRYYWKTGQRWSSDNRSIRELEGPRLKLTARSIVILLAGAFFAAILGAVNYLQSHG